MADKYDEWAARLWDNVCTSTHLCGAGGAPSLTENCECRDKIANALLKSEIIGQVDCRTGKGLGGEHQPKEDGDA